MLSRAPALLLVVLLALAAPALGCGSREQLVGLSELADAGGAPDARPDATVCREDGLPCRGAADCCSAACARGICGGGSCAQDGAPCDAPGDCCTGACCSGACRDGGCVEACSPDGSGCDAGADCCSGRCNAGVCGGCSPDGEACGSADACCSGVCDEGVCGGVACSHEPCAIGAPLTADCGGCEAEICRFDPFCCSSSWDEICVGEATGLCGLTCGACAGDGSACASDAACCSGACDPVSGCVTECRPDGRPCAGSDECCDDDCQNGLCGGPACPSDGTACGGCVAESCCAQLNQCLISLACAEDVACFFGCLDEGNGPAVCGFECMNSPETFQLLRCVGRSCGGGTCF
ncbi:hypothetical protein WME75_09150 [Sorangium sp. So ce1014]|uniref:hypothetical protein n=1 Tax=Sorangium sp. So ce1014 TaxID=3133326 RepID=UPI003F60FAA5